MDPNFNQANESIKIGDFDTRSDVPSTTFYWLSAILSIVALLAFWLLDASTVRSLNNKLKEKNRIIQTIGSSQNAEIETKASGLLSAVSELKRLSSDRYPYGEFLPTLYKYVNKDVRIKNLSVTTDGKLTIDGLALSYRAVADQMLAFKNFAVLEELELASVSLNVTDAGRAEVPFVFTAKINKETPIQPEKLTASSGGSQSSSSSSAVAQTEEPTATTAAEEIIEAADEGGIDE